MTLELKAEVWNMGLKMMGIPEMERALEVLAQVPSYESGHRLKRNKGNIAREQ